jgi:putative endonuclease
MAYVYMLRCADNTLYTGYTFDLERRLARHNAGKGAKYTKGRLPVRFAWYAELETPHLARRAEVFLKQLDRSHKEMLVSGELSLAEACPQIWQEEG